MNKLTRITRAFSRLAGPAGRAEATRWLGTNLLGRAARLRAGGPPPARAPRRVVHISPAYFDPDGYIGGGERYPTELAEAMSELVETTLVSFGPRRRSTTRGRLRLEVYPAKQLINGQVHNPYSWRFLPELRRADVVHCHQWETFITAASVFAAAALRRPVFVTDLGGGGWAPRPYLGIGNYVTHFCEITQNAVWPEFADRSTVIFGGVPARFVDAPPAPWPRERRVHFAGRLLPHKGIDVLIRAVDADTELTILGRPYNADYFNVLQELARGKRVRFITDATDEDLIAAYRGATVTVLPSVYTDYYGTKHPRPELLGLTLLESMACGTPAVCTAVGGMPEVVDDGVTGFVVPPSDPEALGAALRRILDDPDLARRMGEAGRRAVEERFTWRHVAEHCLRIYRGEAS